MEESSNRLRAVLAQVCRENLASYSSTMLFVDDGNSDRTWIIIDRYIQEYREITGLKLSRNFSHQNALIAGIETARPYSDCVITIDWTFRMM